MNSNPLCPLSWAAFTTAPPASVTFVPGLGWCGLDPTNNQPTDERYIKLAVGCDYADVPPVRGHYKGTTDRKMDVEVFVEQIE